VISHDSEHRVVVAGGPAPAARADSDSGSPRPKFNYVTQASSEN
jgi:hypothetical protein